MRTYEQALALVGTSTWPAIRWLIVDTSATTRRRRYDGTLDMVATHFRQPTS